jgi:hypothetical protein
MKNRFVRCVSVLMLVALVVLLASAGAPSAFAQVGTPITPPNLFGMTLAEVLGWLIGDAILGVFVAYLLGQFNVPENLRAPIVAGALAVASALVKSLVPFIPPDLLNARLWDLLMIVIGMIPAWIGLRGGALAHAAQVRAAGALPGATTIKLAGL